jgi:hypothetical protein
VSLTQSLETNLFLQRDAMLRILLLAAVSFSVSFAVESSPGPGGAADGGRGGLAALQIRVFNMEGTEIAAGGVDVPAEGMSAYYAFKRSQISWDSQELGGKSIVTKISGVTRALRALRSASSS